MGSLWENLKPRPCRIHWAIARSTRQGVEISRKDQRWRLTRRLFCGLLLCFCKPVIGPSALWENNALEPERASQSERCLYGLYNNISLNEEKPQYSIYFIWYHAYRLVGLLENNLPICLTQSHDQLSPINSRRVVFNARTWIMQGRSTFASTNRASKWLVWGYGATYKPCFVPELQVEPL